MKLFAYRKCAEQLLNADKDEHENGSHEDIQKESVLLFHR